MGGCFSYCLPRQNSGYSAISGSDDIATANLNGSSYQLQMKENELIAKQATSKLDPNVARKEMNMESAFQSSTAEFMDIIKEVSI